MSKPRFSATDERYLGETLAKLKRTVEQGKSNQPNKLQLSEFFSGTLASLAAGSRWILTIEFYSDSDAVLISFPEFSFYLGTDAPVNEFYADDAIVGPSPWPDRSDIGISWCWNYQESDGFNSVIKIELKNNSLVTLNNLIVNFQLRYPSLTGAVS